MSSEESAVEENLDESQRHVLYVSDLYWRADSVTSFFHHLDDKAAKRKARSQKCKLDHELIREYLIVASPKHFLIITGPSRSDFL